METKIYVFHRWTNEGGKGIKFPIRTRSRPTFHASTFNRCAIKKEKRGGNKGWRDKFRDDGGTLSRYGANFVTDKQTLPLSLGRGVLDRCLKLNGTTSPPSLPPFLVDGWKGGVSNLDSVTDSVRSSGGFSFPPVENRFSLQVLWSMVLVNCHRYCCITRERIPVDPFSSKTCRFLNSSKLPDVFSQQGASLKNACLSRYYYISQQRRFRGVWTKRELTCCTFCASLLLSGNPCTAIWIITAMNYEKECNMHVAEINWSTGSRGLFFFFSSSGEQISNVVATSCNWFEWKIYCSLEFFESDVKTDGHSKLIEYLNRSSFEFFEYIRVDRDER